MTASPARGSLPIRPLLAAAALAATAVAGCGRHAETEPSPQAYYRTGFPAGDASTILRRIFDSVKPIQVRGVYRTYVFAENEAPGPGESPGPELFARAVDTTEIDEARRATAIVVAASGGRTLLLTTRHAVHFPDTIVDRASAPRPFAVGGGAPAEAAPEEDAPGAGGGRIRSISVLRETTRWVVGLPGMEFLEVIATDRESDLALVGIEASPADASPLSAPAGDPDRLSWGSFVYVLGYPAGYPVVTRGIVSAPGRDSELTGSFTVDGVWNRGMSGAPILAVRGDGSGLEWVGTARAAAVEFEHTLVAEEGAEEIQDPVLPYDGPIYLERTARILHGINLSIPLDRIRRFTDASRDAVLERGYPLPSLF